MVERIVQVIFIKLKILNVVSGKTLYSLIPQTNIKKIILITKNNKGNINKITPSPFSMPFNLLTKP